MTRAAPRAGGIDWDEIGRRLERSMAVADPASASPEARSALLRARAAALARPLPAPVEMAGGGQIEVLAFEVAGERYAVETGWVAQALPMPALTALPGLPNYVAGIVPFRGQVLAVLDLRSLLALPLSRLAEPAGLVVLQGEAMEFALLADAIAGVQRYPRAALEARPAGSGRLRGGYLIGVAPDRTAVLDAGRLLSDSTLVVQANQ